MARYIDAEKFLENEIKRCGCVPLVGSCTTDNESLAYQLAKAPTADVVEVVRCGKCKHCVEEYRGYYVCTLPTNPHYVSLCHFCSYGERRDT
jgi:hypothetical protein